MPAKPAKSDRAPKSRWSTAERTTPEHSPRRRDGQSSLKPALPAPSSAPTLDPVSRDFADLGVPENLVAALYLGWCAPRPSPESTDQRRPLFEIIVIFHR